MKVLPAFVSKDLIGTWSLLKRSDGNGDRHVHHKSWYGHLLV